MPKIEETKLSSKYIQLSRLHLFRFRRRLALKGDNVATIDADGLEGAEGLNRDRLAPWRRELNHLRD